MRTLSPIATTIAASIFGAASAVAADAPAQIERNVALFDDLVECSEHDDFPQYGLGKGGPCASWISQIEAERQNDLMILSGGLQCTAGDIRGAGNSLVFGDKEHFQFVKALVDECRSAEEY